MTFEADTILNTPIREKDRRDGIILSRDKKGLFSVKSAYHLTVHLVLSIMKLRLPMLHLMTIIGGIAGRLKLCPRQNYVFGRLFFDSLPTKLNIIRI